MKTTIAAALCAALALSACASSPDDIQAQYVSPMQYQSYTCAQIEGELRGIGDRVATLTGQQRRRASQDKWATGVGIVIFWPALFFLMRGDKADELARMKGQYDALVSAGQSKGCAATQPAPAA
ncbi:MAG TPA: hypothetical protein VN018_07840 [Brevundimonas sp.]|nr:hypothetical protein [Brevundimonas sp.]